MAVLSHSQAQESTIVGLEQTMQLGATVVADGLAKYRHTILFAITALLVIAIAAIVAATQVNSTIASLAEEQLINLVEENATRDARHIQFMIIGGGGMAGMAGMGQDSASMDQDPPTGPGSNNSMSMDSGGSTAMTPNNPAPSGKVPLTLNLLVGPTGLPAQYSFRLGGRAGSGGSHLVLSRRRGYVEHRRAGIGSQSLRQ